MDETFKDDLIDAGDAAASGEAGQASPCGGAMASDAEVMACLQKVAAEINSTLELDELLHRVAQQVKGAIGYDSFGIHLLDPLGEELRIRFGVGYPPEVIKHWRLGLGQGLVGIAAQSGQPVRVGDVRDDPRYINAGQSIQSELAIPLQVKKRTIGVLDVGSRQAHYFNESHQRFLSFLAGHLANAIENARLYETLLEQTRSLSLLHEVSRELTSLLDREQLLAKIAQLVKRLVDYQLFAVLLWNEETQLLEHTFLLRHGERIMAPGGLALGQGLCGTAAALRQPIRVSNVRLDPRYVRCPHETDVRSELVVPLVFKDSLVGVIEVESPNYNAFTEQHEQMLSTMASYIAIALENTRLYEKVREDEAQLENDLATAREIQKGLLPEAAPRVPGLEIAFLYEPAQQLGGDIYDFLRYGDGRLAVAVGDVAGKATAAALYGSLAIGILRGHVVEHPCDPAEMLELTNKHLRQSRADNRFLAMAFSVYDSRSKILTVANAGFPRPWLLRGGRAEEIGVEGVPLGLMPDIRYEQKKLALQVGDTVVFCSDGIQDALDYGSAPSGGERLQGLLEEVGGNASAQEIANSILRATNHRPAGRDDHTDDRTVVVLRVTRE